jgi:hypothetical protein
MVLNVEDDIGLNMCAFAALASTAVSTSQFCEWAMFLSIRQELIPLENIVKTFDIFFIVVKRYTL